MDTQAGNNEEQSDAVKELGRLDAKILKIRSAVEAWMTILFYSVFCLVLCVAAFLLFDQEVLSRAMLIVFTAASGVEMFVTVFVSARYSVLLRQYRNNESYKESIETAQQSQEEMKLRKQQRLSSTLFSIQLHLVFAVILLAACFLLLRDMSVFYAVMFLIAIGVCLFILIIASLMAVWCKVKVRSYERQIQ